MRLSQKFLDYGVELSSIVPYTATNAERLQIAAAEVEKLNAGLKDWRRAMGAYKNPATHTPQAVGEMQAQYEATHSFTQGLKRQLKANMAITLTAADYQNLYIHQDEPHRHHVPIPSVAPSNALLETNHLVNQIFTLNPTPGQERVTALPVDVKAIGRALCLTESAETPPKRAQYHNLEAVGATTYELVFAPENARMNAWLITWYVNNRGETGPESAPLSFMVV